VLTGEVVELPLRGAPGVAFARFTPSGPAGSAVDLCGAIRGTPRLTVDEGPRARIPPAALDRPGWGWHDLEADDAGPFRWSDGRDTESLVRLARVGPIRVEVEASGAAAGIAAAPVTLALVVNGAALDPAAMTEGVATYAWTVPVERWRAGMNRVGLRVSDVIRPADVGRGDDRRLLGVAVRHLELTLVAE